MQIYSKMVIRTRRITRILALLSLAACAALLWIIDWYQNFYVKMEDEFLTILPLTEDHIELNKLLNLTSFEYKLQSGWCQTSSTQLLAIIIVTSYVGHDELRASHRAAINSSNLRDMDMERVFLLADIPPSEHYITQNQLESEHSKFGDLLQGNFIEAYRNLSYKHIMGLRWAATSCNRAKFIVKIDDDIVYDIFRLHEYLKSMEKLEIADTPELLAGFILDSKPAIRNIASKWFVSEQEYAEKLYPSYLSGWLYVTNWATALRLVREAQRVPFFWIDDMWVTGIIRERLNIPMKRLNSWYSANAQFLECCIRDLKAFGYECDYMVGPNGGDSQLLVEFVRSTAKCQGSVGKCIPRPAEKMLNRTCVASAKRLLPQHGRPVIEQLPIG